MPIKILICDDQSDFREAFRIFLSAYSDLEVIGEASNGEEALRFTLTNSPDVVLMDLRMPIMDGVEATRRINQLRSTTRVIVLTTFDDDETIFDGLRAGAVGYLLKGTYNEKYIEAIKAAHSGEYFLVPSITKKVVSEFSRISRPAKNLDNDIIVEPLSPREIEVLKIVATGASNREIAAQLFISEGTVKNHLSNILKKLSARDRIQAILIAKEFGIINI